MNWQELSRLSLDGVIDWCESQDWCQAMAACAQDTAWHAEWDVWTHTKMVCRQLSELEGWRELPETHQTILTFTALFHDSAKPATSQVDPETGKIRSPNHAVRGEQLARNELRRLECDLSTREQIAKLVRFHGRPVFLQERSEPSHEVARMSCYVSNRLLHLFALADHRGRTTASSDRSEENLAYWLLLAEELGCADDVFAFANDHARFSFFRQQEPNLHYAPYAARSCRVTMMAGVPGTGKDTYLTRNHEDLPVVSLDNIRREMKVDPTDEQGAVIQTAREQCREYLRGKRSFAFNATNLLKVTRARWIDLFADYDAEIEIIYLEPPQHRILTQNKNRDHSVPESVVRKMLGRVEPPTIAEAHRVRWIAQ